MKVAECVFCICTGGPWDIRFWVFSPIGKGDRLMATGTLLDPKMLKIQIGRLEPKKEFKSADAN